MQQEGKEVSSFVSDLVEVLRLNCLAIPINSINETPLDNVGSSGKFLMERHTRWIVLRLIMPLLCT